MRKKKLTCCTSIRDYNNLSPATGADRIFQFLFLKMICKKKKLAQVAGTDGNFRLSGDCFCSTSAQPRYCVNSPPQERLLYSSTGENGRKPEYTQI